jgi:NAD(P)-dependent dehydrogenase (short-subunit alcohol dehydrogenase family)
MTASVEGKVALVTGAGSGLGRATALTFAREGARVAVADIIPNTGNETVELIGNAGGEALFVQTDVSDAAQVEAMVARTVEAFGGLDIAFNNAGVSGCCQPLIEISEEDWDHIMSINLKGVWLCMKYEIPHMLERGGGAIVNTASIVGLLGLANASDYVTAKHGVVGLTKSAALEVGKSDIRVNAVCPGVLERSPGLYGIPVRDVQAWRDHVANPQSRSGTSAPAPVHDDVMSRLAAGLGRAGRFEEIAETVLWLCSDAASYMTGAAIPVDGGYGVA